MKQLFYYVLLDPDKEQVCKVGITTNPKSSLRAYKTAAPHAVFLGLYEIPDRVHEKRLLDLMRDQFKVKSELVYCNPQIVKNIVEGYFMDNEIL